MFEDTMGEIVAVVWFAGILWAIGKIIYRAGQRNIEEQYGPPRKIGETWVATRHSPVKRNSGSDLY